MLYNYVNTNSEILRNLRLPNEMAISVITYLVTQSSLILKIVIMLELYT